jgi:hypothetical protein
MVNCFFTLSSHPSRDTACFNYKSFHIGLSAYFTENKVFLLFIQRVVRDHKLFLPDFKKNQCVYRKFDENPKYQSSQTPVRWELLLRHAVGQMDGQTERTADKMKWIVAHITQKDLHMEKICSCLTNTVIAPDKDWEMDGWPGELPDQLSIQPTS